MSTIWMIVFIVLSTLSVLSTIPEEPRRWLAVCNLVLGGSVIFAYPDEMWPTVHGLASLAIGLYLSVNRLG